MRVCIAGAGAIGGFMGGRLAEAGHDVTLVTLGDHLEAIRAEGLRIIGTEGVERRVTNLDATDDFLLQSAFRQFGRCQPGGAFLQGHPKNMTRANCK